MSSKNVHAADKQMICTRLHTNAALNAFAIRIQYFRKKGNAFRVVTPFAFQVASFEIYDCPDATAIMH
jgi:hypothetical protein